MLTYVVDQTPDRGPSNTWHGLPVVADREPANCSAEVLLGSERLRTAVPVPYKGCLVQTAAARDLEPLVRQGGQSQPRGSDSHHTFDRDGNRPRLALHHGRVLRAQQKQAPGLGVPERGSICVARDTFEIDDTPRCALKQLTCFI
jgi:hypothetical protein